MPEDSLIVITSAIKTAFIDHPSSGHGTTWDQVAKSDEESIHLAKAVLVALRKAGYSIAKVDDENADNVANLAPPRTPLRTGFPLSPRDAPRNSGSRPVHNDQRLYPRTSLQTTPAPPGSWPCG
jgi:hypothetical protein